MDINEIMRLPDPRQEVKIEIAEVLHEIHGRPHLFERVRLSGWRFPHRAPEPFLAVGKVVSAFVHIAPDGSSASAYFDRPLPSAKSVSFGYGNTVTWEFDLPVEPRRIPRLDRDRLPDDVVVRGED